MISKLITNSQPQLMRILDLISDDNSTTDWQEMQRSKLSVLVVSSDGFLDD